MYEVNHLSRFGIMHKDGVRKFCFLETKNKTTILCFVFDVYSRKGMGGDIEREKERKKRNL